MSVLLQDGINRSLTFILVRATEAQCNETTGAVWAKYGDADGECIRYCQNDLKSGANKRVIFFLITITQPYSLDAQAYMARREITLKDEDQLNQKLFQRLLIL